MWGVLLTILSVIKIFVCFSDVDFNVCNLVEKLGCPLFDRQNIKFYMYNKTQPSTPIIWKASDPIPIKNDSTNYYYDINKPCKILINGWNTDALNFSIPIKDAYLKMLDVYVIVVDYDAYSCCIWLAEIAHGAPDVGATVADMIRQLLNYGTSSELIHIIGHSLGAQIAGFAGKNLSGNIGRITALDAAGVTYDFVSEPYRLTSTDAYFVDQISTNYGGWGINKDCGDANFYVNGGILQYMCNPLDPLYMICSHEMSVTYFTESISNPNRYCAVQCRDYFDYTIGICAYNDVQRMGEYCNRNAKGRYYLQTNSKPTYGILC